MKHTPGKLTTDNQGSVIFGKSVGGCQMKEREFPIAMMRGWGHLKYLGIDKAREIQKANAQRIVHCWNNHDELLEACKKALVFLKAVMIGSFFLKEIIIILEQAIAKAEGK